MQARRSARKRGVPPSRVPEPAPKKDDASSVMHTARCDVVVHDEASASLMFGFISAGQTVPLGSARSTDSSDEEGDSAMMAGPASSSSGSTFSAASRRRTDATARRPKIVMSGVSKIPKRGSSRGSRSGETNDGDDDEGEEEIGGKRVRTESFSSPPEVFPSDEREYDVLDPQSSADVPMAWWNETRRYAETLRRRTADYIFASEIAGASGRPLAEFLLVPPAPYAPTPSFRITLDAELTKEREIRDKSKKSGDTRFARSLAKPRTSLLDLLPAFDHAGDETEPIFSERVLAELARALSLDLVVLTALTRFSTERSLSDLSSRYPRLMSDVTVGQLRAVREISVNFTQLVAARVAMTLSIAGRGSAHAFSRDRARNVQNWRSALRPFDFVRKIPGGSLEMDVDAQIRAGAARKRLAWWCPSTRNGGETSSFLT